jgi:hypothetical protein
MNDNNVYLSARAAEILGNRAKARHFAGYAAKEAARLQATLPFFTILLERDQQLVTRVGHGGSVSLVEAGEVWDCLARDLPPASSYFGSP